MAYGKGLRPLQVLSMIIFVRILSVFLVQTWYVPDEYWQTLEVSHKQVFGYGALPWEWQVGLRSYLTPSIVSALYWLLKVTTLDHPLALILVPRILQALLSSYADYRFYKWTGERKWALFLILTSWFWFYTASRTLLQTTETSLVAIALSLFPFKDGRLGFYEKESSWWLLIASICTYNRVTSAPIWAVLAGYSLLNTNQGRLRLLVRTYVPIVAITVSALIALDSYFFGRLIVTPWEFIKYNVLNDIGSFYGTLSWHWYLWQGLPAVLGVALPITMYAIVEVLRRPQQHRTSTTLLAAAAAHLTVHSTIPHKEFRFVLPLLPMLLYVTQDVIVPLSRKAKKWQLYVVAAILLIGNVVPALYFSMIHQSGVMKVMPLLRESVNNHSSIVFLMPCHSTPLYSHLHKNVTTRYLHCEPTQGQVPESDAFFNNPQRWWRNEYSTKQTPTHVILFDVLKGRVENVLSGYRLIGELPHTQFPKGEVGEKVLVYRKVQG